MSHIKIFRAFRCHTIACCVVHTSTMPSTRPYPPFATLQICFIHIYKCWHVIVLNSRNAISSIFYPAAPILCQRTHIFHCWQTLFRFVVFGTMPFTFGIDEYRTMAIFATWCECLIAKDWFNLPLWKECMSLSQRHFRGTKCRLEVRIADADVAIWSCFFFLVHVCHPKWKSQKYLFMLISPVLDGIRLLYNLLLLACSSIFS